MRGQVLELQSQLERVSRQADETGRCLHAAVEAARRSEAAARDQVKTLELCNEQLLSEKEWTWDTMQAMEVGHLSFAASYVVALILLTQLRCNFSWSTSLQTRADNMQGSCQPLINTSALSSSMQLLPCMSCHEACTAA